MTTTTKRNTRNSGGDKDNGDDFRRKHPYGTTLLARDSEANRQVWKTSEIGIVDVNPSICSASCPPYTDHMDATEPAIGRTPIHLLIASFRDRLCPRTLHNVFQRAKYPDRIYVRILLQNQPDSNLIDDGDCWDRYCQEYNPTHCTDYRHQVHTVRVDASEAKGPTDARSKLSAMIYYDYLHGADGLAEFQPVTPLDFCLQTDSHMDFSTDYDVKLIQMWHRCRNNNAVLSTYVADIEQNNMDPRVVPNLCMVTFTSSIRNWGTKECTGLVQPKLTTMWGAGLSFHRCHAELVVPVDPYTDQVFDGEEGSRAIRFFTHGYDIYTPDKVLVTHDYHTHQSNPVVHTWGGSIRRTANRTNDDNETNWRWMDDIRRERAKVTTFGTPRINMLLGIGTYADMDSSSLAEIHSIRSSRYGLGTKRTLQQAADFTGLDLGGKKMIANKCGNLKWVPYTTSPDYGLAEVLARPLVPPYTTTTTTLTADNRVAGVPPPSSSAGAAAVVVPRQMQARNNNNNNKNSSSNSGIVVGGVMLAILSYLFRKRLGWTKRKKEMHVA